MLDGVVAAEADLAGDRVDLVWANYMTLGVYVGPGTRRKVVDLRPRRPRHLDLEVFIGGVGVGLLVERLVPQREDLPGGAVALAQRLGDRDRQGVVGRAELNRMKSIPSEIVACVAPPVMFVTRMPTQNKRDGDLVGRLLRSVAGPVRGRGLGGPVAGDHEADDAVGLQPIGAVDDRGDEVP